MKKRISLAVLGLGMIFLMGAAGGCEDADDKDRMAQEDILEQGRQQAGLPSITHFQEKKRLKQILEMRDQADLQTYTYIVSMSGELKPLGNNGGRSIGFGIPAATQYTSPQKQGHNYQPMPQADPNGLFSPAAADGTWVMMVDPKGDPHPVYVEPRIIVSPFPLM